MLHRTGPGLRSLVFASILGFGSSGATAAEKGLAYVTNQEGGVAVIDLATLEQVATIDVEAKVPRGLGLSADGRCLITANRDGGDVSVIDTAARKVIKHIRIGKNPEFVRVRGERAYVTFEPSSKGGPPPKDGKPEKDDDEDDADREPAKVAIIDMKTWKVIGTVTGGPETEGIEFTADGKHMLVTNEADNTVTSHNLATRKLSRTLDTTKKGIRPRGIKAAPDGKTFAVTLEFGDKLLLIDEKLKPLATAATGKTPYGVSWDRAGKRIFVAAARAKELQVFDAATLQLLHRMPVGDRCWHFSFTPDDAQILVACGRSHDVLVFDAKTYAPVKRIENLALPWGIVTWPRSVGSLDAP
jgi:YVTN family beta-propeller protein